MAGTSGLVTVSTKQERIAMLARQIRGAPLTTLSHHIDIDWLREAHRRTRKDGAPGVDGQTASDYEANLEENLRSLLDRAKSGDHYTAPPVRRAFIPKADGKLRPIGIPTHEDKVLQRAVAMVLEPVYEREFLPCSYGFRPGRNAHDALESVREQAMEMAGGWIVELDIESFFDSVDRTLLQEMIRQRIRDGVLLRLIGKWLKAGVMEEGRVHHPESGTPQGGVISPLLANIYLHEVLDTWFERDVRPRLRGHGFLVRYADDAVLVFKREDDARRVLDVLPKRFGRYGLRLHPTKTRLLRFERPTTDRPTDDGAGTGGGFDLLGFTHFWARSRRGYWVIKKKTARTRFSRTLCALNEWCRANRHEPIRRQHEVLNQKLRGHDAYYGVTGNFPALAQLRRWTERMWRKWLSRRSWHARMSWQRMNEVLAALPLAPPRIVHRAQLHGANP